MRKLIFALALLPTLAHAQSVQQSGTVTRGHLPYWTTNGVIADGGTSADSPITSIGATGSICSNSARISSGAWINLCLGYVSGVPTISVQNNGIATAQPLQFVINGTTYSFPGSMSTITIGSTAISGGTNGNCLYVASPGVVGQQACTLSAITSLTGDITATGPGISAATLATVNASPGTYGSGAQVPVITVNGKGLATLITQTPIQITVNSTTIGSGTGNAILYQNGTVLGEIGIVNSGVVSYSSIGVPQVSTTLPTGLTIPGPTFTGTMTMPDSSTWANTGLGLVAALGVGSRTVPAGGNVDISGSYLIAGTQIAAANLSNGTTGSGSIVLNSGPTMAGTWAGNITFSGNKTFSGQLIETGTSAPSSAAGNTVVLGTLAAPTLSNNGQAFVYNTVVNGAVVQGAGSTYDSVLTNKTGGVAAGVLTGTTQISFPGTIKAAGLSSGTCSSGLALDSSNNAILVACPGGVGGIQVGGTNVTSGVTNQLLYDNSGVLGEITKGNNCVYQTNGTGVPSCAVLSTNTMIAFGTGAILLGTNLTDFIGLALLCTTEATCFVPMPAAGTIKNMYANAANAPGGGQTYTFTARKASSDQTVTCQMSGAGVTTCNDTTHSFSVSAADNIDIKVTSSNGAASVTGITVTMQLVTTSP